MRPAIVEGLFVVGLALGSAAGAPSGNAPTPNAPNGNAQGGNAPSMNVPTEREASAMAAGWPDASRQAAEGLLAEYGRPDKMDRGMLEWDERGSFKRIVVRAFAPAPWGTYGGVVENTIRSDVPGEAGIIVFKSAIVLPDRVEGEISALGSSEAANILALNRENRILAGEESVAQAREAYTRRLALSASGKTSAETQRLLFKVKGP
jgi:hypothetical protein